MVKKKTSKKREKCFEDVPIIKPSRPAKIKKFAPEDKLKDKEFVAKALFEALSDGDEAAAIEIINAYIAASTKTAIAKHEKMPTSTVYHALSSKGNPTLKTIAKVLHAVAA